jgi:aminoglycoside 2'-N-acetyltransferase I
VQELALCRKGNRGRQRIACHHHAGAATRHADRLHRDCSGRRWLGACGRAAATSWPAAVLARLPWQDVTWAHADRRVPVWTAERVLASDVGLFDRNGTWNNGAIRLAGVVAWRPEPLCADEALPARRCTTPPRRSGRQAMPTAACCSANRTILRSLKARLAPFGGKVFVEQPAGRGVFAVLQPLVLDLKLAPRTGVLDLCGLPW